jgi:hypothetical protein
MCTNVKQILIKNLVFIHKTSIFSVTLFRDTKIENAVPFLSKCRLLDWEYFFWIGKNTHNLDGKWGPYSDPLG